MKDSMLDSTSAFPAAVASGPEAILDSSSSEHANGVSNKPAIPALACAISRVGGSRRVRDSPFVEYSPPNCGWTFKDRCRLEGPLLFRNSVFQNGELFEVVSFALHKRAWDESQVFPVLISRNVASLEPSCLAYCSALDIVVFESDSHLGAIPRGAFSSCYSLTSLVIPSFVRVLGEYCFNDCRSLQSVVFGPRSRLATINDRVFGQCLSLTRLVIPASTTTIHPEAFAGSGIRSIEIEEGSVSFRVRNGLLVDFEVRTLVWVIGSPEEILIPSSIEELRPFCCAWKEALRAVEFESGSNLRSLGPVVFPYCLVLESICIPSSVEAIRDGCFSYCYGLRTVTFGTESKLRVVELTAFEFCRSLTLPSFPASVQLIDE
jgi:hypothetical protein